MRFAIRQPRGRSCDVHAHCAPFCAVEDSELGGGIGCEFFYARAEIFERLKFGFEAFERDAVYIGDDVAAFKTLSG